MRILHCCLAAFFIDDFGYQENILPKMHKNQGHEVQIVASTETYLNQQNLGYVKPSSYLTAEGIKVTRLPYIRILPEKLARKLRLYSGLRKMLDDFKPELLFLHDVQFLSIWEIVSYVKRNKTIVYADSHTDLINSAKSWLSLNVLHKIIYKQCAKIIEPFTKRFYGTLPLRNDFLEGIYGVARDKIELLPLGADDTILNRFDKNSTRSKVRDQLGFQEHDFVVVSGGKIDKRKNLHLLLEAFRNISNPEIKLILFGSITDDIRGEIEANLTLRNVTFLGWLSTEKVYEILLAADLGFFPGTHSVLWEQCVGTGLPCVFKKWLKIQHVDIGGNCRFLEDVSPNAIKAEIEGLFKNRLLWEKMKAVSVEKGIDYFSYSKIARFAIDH